MFNVSTHKHHLPEYSVNLLHTVELSRKYLHKTQITLCNTLHNVPNPPPKSATYLVWGDVVYGISVLWCCLVECTISTLGRWAHGSWTRANRGFILPILLRIHENGIVEYNSFQANSLSAFVTPCGWNLGAETCSSRHVTWRGFNDLCFNVFYWVHFVG